MNSQPIRAKNIATTFAVARRIERALRPVIDQMKNPGDLHIEVALRVTRHSEPFHLNVSVFCYDRDGDLQLPLYETGVTHTDEIPRLVRRLEAHNKSVRDELSRQVASDGH